MNLGTVHLGTVHLGTVHLGTVHLGTAGLAVAGGTAFLAVFGVFLAAFVVLAVVTVRWAVRRDRVGRAEWVERRSAEDRPAGPGPPAARAEVNGHVPGPGPRRAPGRRDTPGRRDAPAQQRRPGRPRKGAPRRHPGPGATT